jgi:serine/threonine-protein phosphatase 5
MASQEAIELKNKGNKAFKEHDWPGAIDFYTKAIEIYDKDASFFCNRSQANIKMESYGYAIADATHAIDIDPGYIKVFRSVLHNWMNKLTPSRHIGGEL